MKVPTREYFLTARGWKPIALAVALALIMVLIAVSVSHASTNKTYPVSDAPTFVKHFKAGDFSHTRKSVPYSRAFKRAYKAAFIRAEVRHFKKVLGRTDCTDTHTCAGWISAADAWTHQTQHDTCAANVGNDFSSVACQLTDSEKYNILHLVDSPYWQRRGELQNKWTIRVIWCGGVGLATFYTGGTAAAAIGPGATACVGGFFVG